MRKEETYRCENITRLLSAVNFDLLNRIIALLQMSHSIQYYLLFSEFSGQFFVISTCKCVIFRFCFHLPSLNFSCKHCQTGPEMGWEQVFL